MTVKPMAMEKSLAMSLAMSVALLLLPGCGGSKERALSEDASATDADAGVNVLLITLDTTRADHLGCYGYAGAQTPNIDALARDGVVFENAYAVQPVTLPAHSSIMTGKYPFHHGVRDNNIYRLESNHKTLAESLSERGFLTSAFLASCILDSRFGLSQGFKFYNDKFIKPQQKGRLPVDRRAAEVSFLANAWLEKTADARREHPFFLWLHYYDPHAVYDAPVPFGDAYGNPYDAEIAYMDDWIGYTIDKLKAMKLYDNTAIVIVGDHGESLGEHGEKTHGMLIYDATVHVPLIIKLPRNQQAGRRVTPPVSQVDIFATVADLAGINTPGDMDGRNLMPLIAGGIATSKPVYSETFIPNSFGWASLHGIRTEQFFYLDANTPELYPAQRSQLIANERSGQMKEQLQAMQALLKQWPVREMPQQPTPSMVDATLAAQLQQLGYVIGDGAPAPQKRDAKEMIGLFNRYQQAASLRDLGKWEKAQIAYGALLEADPDNPRFIREMAAVLETMEAWQPLVTLCERWRKLNSVDPEAQLKLARAHLALDNPAAAETVLRGLLQQDNMRFEGLFQMATVLFAKGAYLAAVPYLERALAIRKSPAIYNNLGVAVMRGAGNDEKARMFVQRAIDAAIDKAPYQYSMADLLIATNALEEALAVLVPLVDANPSNVTYLERLIAVYKQMNKIEKVNHYTARRRALSQLHLPGL